MRYNDPMEPVREDEVLFDNMQVGTRVVFLGRVDAFTRLPYFNKGTATKMNTRFVTVLPEGWGETVLRFNLETHNEWAAQYSRDARALQVYRRIPANGNEKSVPVGALMSWADADRRNAEVHAEAVARNDRIDLINRAKEVVWSNLESGTLRSVLALVQADKDAKFAQSLADKAAWDARQEQWARAADRRLAVVIFGEGSPEVTK